ncbi:unnamed protein product [Kuraishia capsulata CBS 1993]|uniref:37S ribosomal protein S28, mitochondrial n=1 Tax=Kuraishia capsulata CBS 1993 TaxID=1382522 RepID=W6MGW6_9ASCO|nr:uncharacterized protein KUCA_T00001098001 [Kuraishia capsulata CBS 1993]CDK25131.1 unnamed protein product [Kuraishia capsulata CBS 1993]
MIALRIFAQTSLRPLSTGVKVQAAPFSTSTFQYASALKTAKRAKAMKIKQKNEMKQSQKAMRTDKVDPVLGKAENPFLVRLKAELAEPEVLSKGFETSDVQKLLFGAEQAVLVLNERQMGSNEVIANKVKLNEQKKRLVISRVLSMKNSNKVEQTKFATKLAREEFARFPGDTGSSEVQAAILTVRIHSLMDHVKSNPKDLDAIRDTRMLVQKRQKLLRYLKKEDAQKYFLAIEKLGLSDEAVNNEFNMDRRYMQDFSIWPGRVMVKESKRDLEERKLIRRTRKKAVRAALASKAV